jgi:hypothetical protein
MDFWKKYIVFDTETPFSDMDMGIFMSIGATKVGILEDKRTLVYIDRNNKPIEVFNEETKAYDNIPVVYMTWIDHSIQLSASDERLIREFVGFVDEPIIGWNSIKYDIAKVNTRAMKFGIPTLDAKKSIDLMLKLKKTLSLHSFSLANVIKTFHTPEQTKCIIRRITDKSPIQSGYRIDEVSDVYFNKSGLPPDVWIDGLRYDKELRAIVHHNAIDVVLTSYLFSLALQKSLLLL